MADNTDVFQSFLVAVGFDVKSADASKVQEAVKKVEAALTITVQTETQKRVEAEDKAAKQRAQTNEHLQSLVTQGEKEASDKRDKAKREQDTKDKRLEDDRAKRNQQQRDRDLKETNEFNRKIAESAVNAIKTIRNVIGAEAVMGVARDLLSVTDQAAKNFERLGYMSARVGSSAKNVSAFGYAASQTGSSVSEAQSGLEAFSRNMRMNEQGRVNQLRGLLGINARGSDGRLRDSSEILADVGDSLRTRSKTPQGYAQSVTIAQSLGIDENLLRAITNPEFRKYVTQFRKDNSVAGADQDAAAKGGTQFEQAVRHVVDIIDAVKTRVETGLFNLVAPQLDKIAKWIDDHSQQISSFIDTLAKNLIKLGEAFANSDAVQSALESLQSGLEWTAKYVASDDFKKDIKDFGTGIVNLAKAVRKALEFLGILPGSAGASSAEKAAADSDAQADAIHNNQGVFGNAMVRGHRGGLFHTLQNQADPGKVKDRLGGFRGGNGSSDATHVPSHGKTSNLSNNQNATQENADSIKAAAKELGTTPEDLATVIGYETGGTFSPSKWGGKDGNYMGLIQFGPSERKQYGANENQTFPQQMEAVKRYLKGRGFKPGMGLMDLYSTINAGSPGHYGASDGNGTVRSHVANMQQNMAPTARAFLARGTPDTPVPEISRSRVSDSEVLAARQRLASGGNDPADRDLEARYLKQQNTPAVTLKPHDAAHDNYEKRTFGRYIHSAMKLAKSGEFADPLSPDHKRLADAMAQHAAALRVVAHAKSGTIFPFLHRPLGAGHPANDDHSKTVHLTQANTYNVNHQGELKTAMNQTEVHASRGVQDLLRNTRGVEA